MMKLFCLWVSAREQFAPPFPTASTPHSAEAHTSLKYVLTNSLKFFFKQSLKMPELWAACVPANF